MFMQVGRITSRTDPVLRRLRGGAGSAAPLIWTASLVLAAVRAADYHLHIVGFIIVAVGAGFAASTCGIVQDMQWARIEALIRELADVSQQRADELRSHLLKAG